MKATTIPNAIYHCWQQQAATNNAFTSAFAITEAMVAHSSIHLHLSKKIGQCNTDPNACNMSSNTINIFTT
jgi:hypothetical protein